MKQALLVSFVVAGAGLLAAALPAAAHHSFAMYDQTKTVTVTGKLNRFIVGANHSQLIFYRIGPDGKAVLDSAGNKDIWGVETGPASQIAERGITVKSFPLGTVLTVTLNPLRNGKHFGALARDGMIIKCGNALPKDGCNENTGEVFKFVRRGQQEPPQQPTPSTTD
jgi:hypothetical protein